MVRFYKANSDMSLQEIGEIFKISRQRVFQILKRQKELEDNHHKLLAGGNDGKD